MLVFGGSYSWWKKSYTTWDIYITHYKNPCNFWDPKLPTLNCCFAGCPNPHPKRLQVRSWVRSILHLPEEHPQEIHFHRAGGFSHLSWVSTIFFWLRDITAIYPGIETSNCSLLHGKKHKKKGPHKKISFFVKSGWLVILYPTKTMGFLSCHLRRGEISSHWPGSYLPFPSDPSD